MRTSIRILISISMLFLTVAPAAAQTISDSNGGAPSTLTFGAAPATTLTVGGIAGNCMPRTWWWYRNDAPVPDTREYPLTNQTASNFSGNSAGFEYIEPPTGTSLFKFDVGYVIQDNTDPQARLVESVFITNLDVVPHDLTFFAFVDVSLPDASADGGTLNAPGIQIADAVDAARIEPTFSLNLRVYEADDAATLLGELNDNALSNYANGGLPYSGPDFSAVYQWTITGLLPSNSAVLGLNVIFNAGQWPCQGDIDNDGQTTLTDLANLLSKFGTAGAGIPCDLDGNLVVDIADLTLLLSAFGCS